MLYVKGTKEGYAEFFSHEPDKPYFMIEETDIPERPDDGYGSNMALYADVGKKELWWERVRIPTELEELKKLIGSMLGVKDYE